MNQQPDFSRAWAFVVGIDRYQDSAVGDLRHQADHACRFAQWLRDRGVPPQQIFLFLSGETPARVPGVKRFPDAHRDTIFNALDVELRNQREQQDLLFIYWGGHGLIAGDHRSLLAADAEVASLRGIDLDSLLTSLRTEYFPFHRQAVIVDACAQHFPNKEEVKPRDFAQKNLKPGNEQYVLFSAAEVETARDGLFSPWALDWLEANGGDWPPDLERMSREVKAHFDGLRKQGLASQAPICIRHRGWRGDEDDLFGSLGELQETSRAIREARRMLDQIEFGTGDWRAHYRATSLYLDRPLPAVDSRDQMIGQLARAGLRFDDDSKSDCPRPLVEFAWRAARASADAALLAEIEKAIVNRTHLATLKDRGARESLDLPLCLIVELTTTASLQRPFNTEFKWWLWDETRRKAIESRQCQMDGSLEGLRNGFLTLLDDCKQRHALPQLQIEFFVNEAHLLSFAPDRWDYKAGELGGNDPVSLRLAARKNKQDWIAAARAVRASGKRPGIQWLPGKKLEKRKLAPYIRNGKCGPILGVAKPPLEDGGSLDLLMTALIEGGAPFALWPRSQSAPKSKLDNSIQAGALDDVPVRIREHRLELPDPPVSLFWDDPERDPVRFGFSAP